MTCRLSTISLFIGLVTFGCKTTKLPSSQTITASISQEGLLTCFSPGTSLNNNLVWCEASAVVYDGKNVLFANDKDMPQGQSPVFAKSLATLADSTQLPTPILQPAFTAGRKYEDFAQTPDRKFIFLTTAFDRVKSGSHDWDGYNTILYWRSGDEQHPYVLSPDDTSRTSIAYRQRIAQLLASDEFPNEMPYFKIEGLAATDKQLLFGIREDGKAYDSFKYRAKIIGVTYNLEQTGGTERIRLENDWKIINDFVIVKADTTLPQPLALSSLEYDPYRNRFWMLTSLESGSTVDAYLWTITPAIYMLKPFSLVRNAQRAAHSGRP